jgi:cellobiose-specific phosphotransferase system component IIC
LVAGASGLLLLIALSLHWYHVKADSPNFPQTSGTVSGWAAFTITDLLLALIALVALAVAAVRLARSVPRDLPRSPGFLVLAAGVIATLVVLLRIAAPGNASFQDIPGLEVTRLAGIFVALVAALGITLGGWLIWSEEGRPTSRWHAPRTRPLGSEAPETPSSASDDG